MVSRGKGGRRPFRPARCAVLVAVFAATLSVTPPVTADQRGTSCAERKAGALDWIDYVTWQVGGALTSSLRDPQVVPATRAAGAMRRIERQVKAVAATCLDGRFVALEEFAEQARELTTGAMDQVTTGELLAAFDTYRDRQTHQHVTPTSVQSLHRCQARLPEVRTTYRIDYSGPKPFGRYGWVTLTTENHTDSSVWVELEGSMVAVRPLPRQGGEYVATRGGRVYGWGGSSSDLQYVDPGGTQTSYASPSWYKLKLRSDGFIKAVRPQMWVRLGAQSCSSPVLPS